MIKLINETESSPALLRTRIIKPRLKINFSSRLKSSIKGDVQSTPEFAMPAFSSLVVKTNKTNFFRSHWALSEPEIRFHRYELSSLSWFSEPWNKITASPPLPPFLSRSFIYFHLLIFLFLLSTFQKKKKNQVSSNRQSFIQSKNDLYSLLIILYYYWSISDIISISW